MKPEETLGEWMTEHHVWWELSPLREFDGHKIVSVGFELCLFARHGAGEHASPGCNECVELYDTLETIVSSVFPREKRKSRYEIDAFDHSFHLRPQAGLIPEVQLTVRITHRERYFEPVDECEKKCAHEIEDGLRGLRADPKGRETRPGARPARVDEAGT